MFESEFPAKRGTCSSNAKNIRMKVTVENVFRAESSWYSNDFIWLSCDLYFFFFFFHCYHFAQVTGAIAAHKHSWESETLREESGGNIWNLLPLYNLLHYHKNVL